MFRDTTNQVLARLEAKDAGPVFKELTTSASSGSALRNYAFILNCLKKIFIDSKKVFEIGSGTGHHACLFATELNYLLWQTSDAIEKYRETIKETMQQAQTTVNLPSPVPFDTATDELPKDYDAIYMSNVLHCMSDANAKKVIGKAGEALPEGGLFVVFGPLKIHKNSYAIPENNGEGNRNFDIRVKNDNPEFGIKKLEEIRSYAKSAGMKQTDRIWDSRSNNHLVVFTKVQRLQEPDYDLSCLNEEKIAESNSFLL